MTDRISASEALYGFAGWLTSRNKPLIFSAAHDAAAVADAVDDFCKANNLDEPQKGWEKHFVYPTYPAENEGGQ